MIKDKVARMTVDVYALESVLYLLTAALDQGKTDVQMEAAAVKIFASEAAWRVMDTAVSVVGGVGYMRTHPYERFLRDSRVFSIIEGTNDILRLSIAMAGLQIPQRHLDKVFIRARGLFKDPKLSVPYLLREILGSMRNRLGLGGPKLQNVHPSLKTCQKMIESSTLHFGKTVFAALQRHREAVSTAQMDLKRIADSTIDLYVMVAVTSRASRALAAGDSSGVDEGNLATIFCTEASERINRVLNQVETGLTTDSLMTSVADKTCDMEAYPYSNYHHPLKF